MKEKCTARLPHRAASTRRISASAPSPRSLGEGGFLTKHAAPFALFSLRACIWPALICALSASVYANLITVTNTNDNGSGSLRGALAHANDGDTIEFAVTGTIGLTSGELLVDKSITISGPGTDILALNANAKSRVFHIAPGKVVTISGLTVTNGRAFGFYPNNEGAGILNDHGTVVLNNCAISGNVAENDGGGVCNDGTGGAAIMSINNSTVNNNSAGHGGGVYNDGRMKGATLLQISNTTLNNNSSGDDAGAILNIADTKDTATVSNCTISGNSAQSYGGGILNAAGLTISNTTFTGNWANFGGSIANSNATVSIGNSVLNAGNTGGNLFNDTGTVTSRGYNVSSDDGGGYLNGPGDQVNTDPVSRHYKTTEDRR